MADLQEVLNKRERRSRVVAFIIGLIVITILLLIFVGFTSNNDSADNSGADTEQVASSDGEVNEENVFDVFDDSDTTENTSAEGTDSEAGATSSASTNEPRVADTDGEVAGDSTGQVVATGDSDELPNTGPVENAIFGTIAIIATSFYFARSKSEFAKSLRK